MKSQAQRQSSRPKLLTVPFAELKAAVEEEVGKKKN